MLKNLETPRLDAQAGRLRVRLTSRAPIALEVAFDCAAGELIALVGPSGSGKTTVLRSIAGLHVAADMQGEISVGGQAWFTRSGDTTRLFLSPQMRRVGMVFQQYALFPHLTALQNIAINDDLTLALGNFSVRSAQKKSSESSQQLAALMARLGLADLAQRLPSQLSGGQQQRVALARALWRLTTQGWGTGAAMQASGQGAAHNGVLLLDEPFSAVDAPTRQTLYTELASLRQHIAVPMVLVTHDLAEARRLADRVVIIDAGTSLQSGTPSQVFSSPRNARVALLVGIQNHFSGVFYRNVTVQSSYIAINNEANLQANGGVLQWGHLRLRVTDKGKIDDNTAVTWVLAAQHLEIRAASAGGNALTQDCAISNVVHCTLTQRLELGEMCVCRLRVHQSHESLNTPHATADLPVTPDPDNAQELSLNLSTAFLRSLQADVGAQLEVLIPPEAVHIMPLKT